MVILIFIFCYVFFISIWGVGEVDISIVGLRP